MSDALIHVTERLYRDFRPHDSRPDIVELVARCRTELDTAPTGARPELVERLARHRLTAHSTPGEATATVAGSSAPSAEIIQMAAFSAHASMSGSQCDLALAGEVDLEVADALTEMARSRLADPGVWRLVIDLGTVTFMDSTALGALVAIRNAAGEMGKATALCNVPEGIHRLLVITGLDAVFAVNPNSDAAAKPDVQHATFNGNH